MLKQAIFSFTQKYKVDFEALLDKKLQPWKQGDLLKQSMVYALQNGGKRFRPSLVMMLADHWSCRSFLQPLALAVEFFHTASLIADDLPCMDDAVERRGKPSLHSAFSEDIALLASYALISEGYKEVTLAFESMPLPDGKKALLLSQALYAVCQNTGLQGAVGGQFLDIHSQDFCQEKVEETLKLKTVTLFELPLVLAWLGGKQTIEGIEEVRTLAFHFGLAFQLADDLMDLEEDQLAGRSMNWGVLFGEKACREKLAKHARAFVKQAEKLQLHLPAFQGLNEYFMCAIR